MTSRLWDNTVRIPETLARTLNAASGVAAVAEQLRDSRVHRIVISGNGAAWYAGLALWLASLEAPTTMPAIISVPAGLVARGRFAWREGDALLAISSSGEFRDIVEAVTAPGAPLTVAVSGTATSTLATTACATALADLGGDQGFTHSGAYAANVALGLSILAEMTDDDGLRNAVSRLPSAAASAIEDAAAWDIEQAIGPARPRMVLALGDGPGWAAALEASLLVREVAGLPAEGVELREGATSSMFGIGPNDLAALVGIAGSLGDGAELETEAAAILHGRGARMVRLPGASHGDRRLASILAFPASVRLAIHLAEMGGLDPDDPASARAYHGTSRVGAASSQ